MWWSVCESCSSSVFLLLRSSISCSSHFKSPLAWLIRNFSWSLISCVTSERLLSMERIRSVKILSLSSTAALCRVLSGHTEREASESVHSLSSYCCLTGWCNISRNAPLYGLNFSSELTSCRQTQITCWGKWNATWHFISTVLLMSFRGWNTDWAITWGMICSVTFICIKTSSIEDRMMALRSGQVCARHGSDTGTGADRGRLSQCLCWVYSSTFLKLNRPRSGSPKWVFIQPYVMPHQRLSKRHLLFEYAEKKILFSFCTHAYRTERPVPKRFGKNMCTLHPDYEISITNV